MRPRLTTIVAGRAAADHFALKGDLARDRSDWSTATAFYRKALRLNPTLMPIWVQFGHGLKEGGDYRAAEEAYLNALALDDRVADTHLQLGHLMNLQARRSEALSAYATASKLDPDFAEKFLAFVIREVIRHHESIQRGDATQDYRIER